MINDIRFYEKFLPWACTRKIHYAANINSKKLFQRRQLKHGKIPEMIGVNKFLNNKLIWKVKLYMSFVIV